MTFHEWWQEYSHGLPIEACPKSTLVAWNDSAKINGNAALEEVAKLFERNEECGWKRHAKEIRELKEE